MCKIQETLLKQGWLPANEYKVVWLKNGSIIYLTDEMVEFIDAIAIENHHVGFEKGAYEQQQQEDAEAAPQAAPQNVPKAEEPADYIDYLMGNTHHSWVERVRLAKRERTHSDHILDMISTCTEMHKTAVEHKCFGAAVSLAAVLNGFHNDLKEVLRQDRLTNGGGI
jgi:hypothetical protein